VRIEQAIVGRGHESTDYELAVVNRVFTRVVVDHSNHGGARARDGYTNQCRHLHPDADRARHLS
jgi:hypothetical protein